MSKIRERRRALSLLAVSLLAGLLLSCSRLKDKPRLRFPYLTRELPAAEYEALARDGFRTEAVAVGEGLTLRGLVRRPKDAQAPWLLFYPGNDLTPLQVGKEVLTRVAQERDYGLAVFAYRGYDGSDGTPHIEQLVADASRVVAHLEAAEHVPPDRLFLLGFSLGGHLAANAAAAANRSGGRAAGLVLMAPASDIVMVRRSAWQRFSAGDECLTAPVLPDVPAPVLVIQGAADETLNGASQGREIAQALGVRARYEELPGAGHQQLLKDDRTYELARAFLAATAAK